MPADVRPAHTSHHTSPHHRCLRRPPYAASSAAYGLMLQAACNESIQGRDPAAAAAAAIRTGVCGRGTSHDPHPHLNQRRVCGIHGMNMTYMIS